MNKPKAPVVFNKQITCVIGPGDGIEVPTVAPDWVDYEGELGIVIGTRCRNVSVDDAPSVVAGYLIVNDVSVRDWQRATPTMTMGKSWDTHGPIGPVVGQRRRGRRSARSRAFARGSTATCARTPRPS